MEGLRLGQPGSGEANRLVALGLGGLGRVELNRTHGNGGLPNVVRADRRADVGARIGPFAVRLLPRLDEHGGSVRIEVGLVIFRVKTQERVAENVSPTANT